jgi:hypothetical protein
MKSTREIFKTNPSLLDEPEVVQGEIIEFRFQKIKQINTLLIYF